MAWLDRLLGNRGPDPGPLYAAVVAAARRPEWYVHGGAEDTLDGRFEVLALVMTRVLVRLEALGQGGALAAARLTEAFVTDMDGQLRQVGIGDLVVGKQIGKAVGALGGRLGVYRAGVTRDAVVRNLWRGEDRGAAAFEAVASRVAMLDEGLAGLSLDALLAGRIA